jgi:hypothetical protein
MQHPSSVLLNLLGPGNASAGGNILMDTEDKHPGITHVSFKISSMTETGAFLYEKDIAISGSFSFMGMDAIFIRDPDMNVIELNAYPGDEPETRKESGGDARGLSGPSGLIGADSQSQTGHKFS